MDNQRNKLHKFLKISQKHNKKYIYISEYIRFVLNFADELGDLTRTIHGSVEIHAPCRTSDPFANIPSFFQPVIPPSDPSSHKREHIRLCVHYTPIMRNAASGSRDAGRRSGTKEEGCPANFRLSQTPGCSRPRHPGSKGPIFSHYFNNRG